MFIRTYSNNIFTNPLVLRYRVSTNCGVLRDSSLLRELTTGELISSWSHSRSLNRLLSHRKLFPLTQNDRLEVKINDIKMALVSLCFGRNIFDDLEVRVCYGVDLF